MRVGINRFCEDGHIKVELSAYKSVRLGASIPLYQECLYQLRCK